MAGIISMLYLVVIATVLTKANKYCKPKLCHLGIHVMCEYEFAEPSERCDKPTKVGLTDKEKKDILDYLNAWREDVALGKVAGHPPAVSMPDLTWNDTLEEFAQRWANQCYSQIYDNCRDTDEFEVGQTMAVETNKGSGYDAWTLDRYYNVEILAQSWLSEEQYLDKKKFAIIHVTTMLGCGCMRYMKDDTYTVILVCNYGPRGNILDKPLYKTEKCDI